jgi:hypothetical protein
LRSILLAVSSGNCPAYRVQLSWRGTFCAGAANCPPGISTMDPYGGPEPGCTCCCGHFGYGAFAAHAVMGGREGEGPRVNTGDGDGDEGDGDDGVRVADRVSVTVGAREEMVSTTPRRCFSPPLASGTRNLRCSSGSSQYSDGSPCESQESTSGQTQKGAHVCECACGDAGESQHEEPRAPMSHELSRLCLSLALDTLYHYYRQSRRARREYGHSGAHTARCCMRAQRLIEGSPQRLCLLP